MADGFATVASCPGARKRARARLTIRHIVGCRAAAFLQKLPWRREANPLARLGLLSYGQLVSKTFEISQGDREYCEGRERIF